MAFRTDLDALVLAVLQTGRLHGYEIGKRINLQGQSSFGINEGQLYPVLHRLENEGKIASEWVPQPGKPARRVYALTDGGRRELIHQRESWTQFVDSVNRILTPMHPEVERG
jgi:DNA-binding PadR family transcriptional regulator